MGASSHSLYSLHLLLSEDAEDGGRPEAPVSAVGAALTSVPLSSLVFESFSQVLYCNFSLSENIKNNALSVGHLLLDPCFSELPAL